MGEAMTTITDEQVEAAYQALAKSRSTDTRSRLREVLTAAAQADPTIDLTKLTFSQVAARIMRVIDHNDAGSGGSRMDLAKAVAKGVFDLSGAMAVRAGKPEDWFAHDRAPPTARPGWWTHDDRAAKEIGEHLYYFAPTNAARSPYRAQKHVGAIIDIADDGTLAGVELINDMPPPPVHEPNRVEPPLSGGDAPNYEGERAAPSLLAASNKSTLSASRQGEPSPEQSQTEQEVMPLERTGFSGPNDTRDTPPGLAPATPGRADDWQLVPMDPTDDLADAGLRATAAHLDIKGSALTVNREKMRVRWRAILKALAASPSPPAQSVEGQSIQQVIMDCIEAIERRSSTAPVVECLRSLLPQTVTLTKELAEHKQARMSNGGKWIAAVRRAEKAEAELAEAKKVIEPFAKASAYYDEFLDQHSNDQIIWETENSGVTAGNLRSARDWLDRNKTDGEAG